MKKVTITIAKALFVFALATLFSTNTFAQGVAINTTGSTSDTSAILDVASTSQGFLMPRMLEAEKNAIVLPATGLMIYQTDGTAGFYYNSGTPAAPVWTVVGTGGGGGGGSSDPTLIYTTDGF